MIVQYLFMMSQDILLLVKRTLQYIKVNVDFLALFDNQKLLYCIWKNSKNENVPSLYLPRQTQTQRYDFVLSKIGECSHKKVTVINIMFKN